VSPVLERALSHSKAAQVDRRLPVAVQIFEVLRAQIIGLQLAPGTPLSRPALAQRFGVSQTPVRDALQRLEQEGLVIVHPQSSTLVAPIDIEQAFETRFLRTALECEVARTLARSPEAYDLGPAALVLDEMALLTTRPDRLSVFHPKDQAFHRALFAAVGREGLWDLVEQRSGNNDRIRNLHLVEPGRLEQIVSDHRAILHAIVAGDPDGAEAAVRLHLSRALATIDDVREKHPQYFR
jgi:DNA-binding GntR family transcriptional regulator